MEANYVHKDSTTLVQDELVKNELNQIELQYNALKQQKFNELLKENHELKEKYLNAVADYEMVMSELQELKKQLEAINEQANYLRKSVERKEEAIIDLQNERVPYANEYVAKLETQQKKFIKYLEDYLNLFDNMDIDEQISYDMIEEILKKYKEIIGGKDERFKNIYK